MGSKMLQMGSRGHEDIVSRNVKAEFYVVIGAVGGQGARISHLVSRNVKAEFYV